MKTPPLHILTALLLAPLAGLHANAEPTSQPVLVTIHPENMGVKIPADFLGFSCEKGVLTEPHFRADNTALLNLFRNLGNGVLRLGGGEVEHTYWSRLGTPAPSAAKTHSKKHPYTIGPTALDNLYAFAKQSGWRVIHGLNLGANDPAMDADEAAYALQVGGPAILAFEIGNEPDLFAEHGHRPTNYGYPQFCREFDACRRAILAISPHASFGGPATTKNCDWFPGFVADFKAGLILTTSHLYPLSARDKKPSSPRFATVNNLLSATTDKMWMPMIEENQKAAHTAGLPYRLGESNTASGGGAKGVSDVFAAALWGADFLFDVAERGVAGINLHGDFNDRFHYSPLCFHDNHYYAHPVYYGMLLFHHAACGRVVPAECQTMANVTAHAILGDDHKLRVVLINKDLKQSVVASIASGASRTKADLIRLSAPSVTSTEDVTLADSAVAKDGTWTPQPGAPVPCVNGKCEVVLSAVSAAMLTIE